MLLTVSGYARAENLVQSGVSGEGRSYSITNSHGNHGTHGPPHLPGLLGFPTSPRSYPTRCGLRMHERAMGDSGRRGTSRGQGGFSVADVGWGGRATLSRKNLKLWARGERTGRRARQRRRAANPAARRGSRRRAESGPRYARSSTPHFFLIRTVVHKRQSRPCGAA